MEEKILSRIKIVKKENSTGFFRVEDKVGLLKERDQTIVTLETEVSEVTYKKTTNIRCYCGSQLQLMLDFDYSLILKSVNSQL